MIGAGKDGLLFQVRETISYNALIVIMAYFATKLIKSANLKSIGMLVETGLRIKLAISPGFFSLLN